MAKMAKAKASRVSHFRISRELPNTDNSLVIRLNRVSKDYSLNVAQYFARLSPEFMKTRKRLKGIRKQERSVSYSEYTEQKMLLTWYYIAHRAMHRIVPQRDLEDLMQEAMVKYVAKNLELRGEEYLLFLLAKETVVQYYRRGKIENRCYRNILLTREYWYRVKDKTSPSGFRMVYRSKYNEDYQEEMVEIPLEEVEGLGLLSDNGKTIELAIDKVFFDSLPYRIREIMRKREEGYSLTTGERVALHRYAKQCKNLFSTV